MCLCIAVPNEKQWYGVDFDRPRQKVGTLFRLDLPALLLHITHCNILSSPGNGTTMPRRKAAGHDATQHTRSRTGCQTCRRRRIKCGSEIPDCLNCTRKGLQCIRETTLKWQVEYEAQGLAFGRAGVWSKRGSANVDFPKLEMATWTRVPEIQPYFFVQYAPPGHLTGIVTQSTTAKSVAVTPRLERPLRLLPQMNLTVDASILTYYVEKLCPLTTLGHQGDSPFVSMILPYLSNASSAVLDATLALAARHSSRTNDTWARTAVELECKATRALRSRIAGMNTTQIAQDPEISIIVMMLCLYEIVSQCDRRWVVHLKGASGIAHSRRTNPCSSTSGLQTFVDRFFAFQDVIGRTACGEEPVFGNTYWSSQDQNVDPWLGCSPALVSIVYSITELGRERQRMSSPELNAQAISLDYRLDMLHQVAPSAGDCNLGRSAEVKSLTARLFLRCALFDAGPSASLVKSLVTDILSHIRWFVDRGLGAGLLWCLFVAAVELDPSNDHYLVIAESTEPIACRPFVLKALETLEYTSISNVSRIRQVIVEVWQARDDSLDAREETPSSNDWETYIAPRSINISLV